MCLLYALVPADVEFVKSKPCELPALISEPLFIGVFGSTPSNPCWNATKKFLLTTSVDAEPVNCKLPPPLVSKPKFALYALVAPTGIGFK
jgi:hypothetical protein